MEQDYANWLQDKQPRAIAIFPHGCAIQPSQRLHQGIDQQIPIALPISNTSGPIGYPNVLGGIIHEYYRDAP